MAESRAILWYSNSPFVPTGYGTQTAMMLRQLAKDNYKVAVAANYGLEGANSHWGSGDSMIPIYARGNDVWSNDTIMAHATHWQKQNPDSKFLIVTLFDVWVFNPKQWSLFPIASWIPIDHTPIPSPVSDWAKQEFVQPIAMSKYGKKQFDNLKIKAHYAPHALEKVWKPTATLKTSNGEINPRQFMKVDENKFCIGINAANKGFPARKAWGENLLAFSKFSQGKDDVVLYMHTDIAGGGGTNILDVLKSLAIPEDKVRWVDQYAYRSGLPQEVVAGIYSEMDVLLATSYGEGFGIPTIEAQACGTPVIVTETAASPELVGDGWLVAGQKFWNPPMKAWYTIPYVDGIIDALEKAYARGKGNKSKKAQHFAKKYDADYIYENNWKPALNEIFSKL